MQQSNIEAEVTRDESDESEDEGDKRGGRFKSERQNIVTITSKPTTHTDIPDTLGKMIGIKYNLIVLIQNNIKFQLLFYSCRVFFMLTASVV